MRLDRLRAIFAKNKHKKVSEKPQQKVSEKPQQKVSEKPQPFHKEYEMARNMGRISDETVKQLGGDKSTIRYNMKIAKNSQKLFDAPLSADEIKKLKRMKRIAPFTLGLYGTKTDRFIAIHNRRVKLNNEFIKQLQSKQKVRRVK